MYRQSRQSIILRTSSSIIVILGCPGNPWGSGPAHLVIPSSSYGFKCSRFGSMDRALLADPAKLDEYVAAQFAAFRRSRSAPAGWPQPGTPRPKQGSSELQSEDIGEVARFFGVSLVQFRQAELRSAAYAEVQVGGNAPDFLVDPETQTSLRARARATGLSQRALRWQPEASLGRCTPPSVYMEGLNKQGGRGQGVASASPKHFRPGKNSKKSIPPPRGGPCPSRAQEVTRRSLAI